MRLLPAASRVSEPWRNGRGRTAVVAAGDGWRVSIAELRDTSPFSSFPGAGRLIMPLSATGVRLSVNGRSQACASSEVCGFDGEDAVFAAEVREPIEVLNLIWRRDRCRGALTAVSVGDPFELRNDGGTLIGVVTSGRILTSDGASPGRLDGLVLAEGESVSMSGSGHLALAQIKDTTPRSLDPDS